MFSQEEKDFLNSVGKTRNLKRGEIFFAAGDEESPCATLIHGNLKISSFDQEGHEQILALIYPGGFVGDIFSPTVHHNVVALSESKVITFSRNKIENAISTQPGLAKILLKRSQDDLLASRKLLELNSHTKAESRIAALLYDFVTTLGIKDSEESEFDLPLTRVEIGNMLGLTVETVSRKIGDLEDQGIILRKDRRRIKLLDIKLLKSLSGR